MMLDISIVTYHSSRWLQSFFDSLLQQQFPLNQIALYIRDNHSTDDTVAQLHDFADRYQQQFHKIEITVGENVGFGAGHNDNLKKSSSEFFLVTNVDLTFEKDALQKVMHIANLDSDKVASWEFRQKPYEHPKLYDPITLETTWSSSACILFRRSALEKIQGYDEKLFLYGEDVDISYRLRDAGYILKYCPTVVCWHYSYEYANEVKPAQYYGSTFSNLFLHIRFGSIKEIADGFLRYFYHFVRGPQLKNRRQKLLLNFFSVLKLLPYLIKTRKKSAVVFPFNGFDYEKTRMGAFYVNQPLSSELPLVSIITRTYQGRLSWLKEAAASLMNQTYPHIEWIVIEDGSETAKEYLTSISNQFTKLIYHSITKAGRCEAGNAALRLAQGDYIGFLDDDDVLFSDHVEVLVDTLQKQSNYDAAYAISITAPTEIISQEPLQYRVRNYLHLLTKPFSRMALSIDNLMSIQSVLFRRKLYDSLGGFDLQLEMLEDWDLWLRYATKTSFYFVEKTTSLYRVPANDAEQLQREKAFQQYLPIAREKQKHYFLENLSFYELSIYYFGQQVGIKKLLRNKLVHLKRKIKSMVA